MNNTSVNFTSFTRIILKNLQEMLGENYSVFSQNVTKNNGIELTGVIAKRKGCNASPTIYINEFYHDMTGSGRNTFDFAGMDIILFAVALAAMLLFTAVHWNSKKGKKTVTAAAYVNGGRPHMNKKEDVLVNKVVTKRKIQTSSGSGGGRSGGGSSHSHGGHHGGAGHHR